MSSFPIAQPQLCSMMLAMGKAAHGTKCPGEKGDPRGCKWSSSLPRISSSLPLTFPSHTSIKQQPVSPSSWIKPVYFISYRPLGSVPLVWVPVLLTWLLEKASELVFLPLSASFHPTYVAARAIFQKYTRTRACSLLILSVALRHLWVIASQHDP